MGYFILFFILSSGSFFCTSFFNKRYEETLPATFMSIIMLLYVFYIFDFLKIGFFITIGVCLLLYIFSFFRILKQRVIFKDVVKNTLTPGFFIFSLLFIVFWLVTRDNSVLLFDELRLWGLYSKSLFYTDRLQFGESSRLLNSIQHYTPAISLFQYFCAKCIGFFAEKNLYLVYSLLGVSVFMPLTKNITWKNKVWIFPTVVLFFVLPMTFSNSQFDGLTYYETLFIDPMLGLFFAFSIFLTTKNVLESRLYYFSYTLSLCVLMLLKENGFIFSIFSFFTFLFNSFFIYKYVKIFKDKKIKINKELFKKTIILFIPLFLAVLSLYSWKTTIRINQSYLPAGNQSEFNFKNIATLFINPSESSKNIIANFMNSAKTASVIHSNFSELNKYLTYKNILILLIVLSITIFILLEKKKDRTIFSISVISILLTTLMYSYALIALYAFIIRDIESFPRYINTVLLAFFSFLIMFVFRKVFTEKNKKFLELFILIIFLSIVLFPFKSPVMPWQYYRDIDYKSEYIISNLMDSIKLDQTYNESVSNKVLLVFNSKWNNPDSTSLLYQHQIELGLVHTNVSTINKNLINIKYFYKDQKFSEFIADDLLKEYQYLYLITLDDDDTNSYNKILPKKLKINNESTLFKINITNDKEKIEFIPKSEE